MQASIRLRLLIGAIISTLFILGGVWVVSYYVIENELHGLFEANLSTSARIMQALTMEHLQQQPEKGEMLHLPENIELPVYLKKNGQGLTYERKIVFQIWDDQGQLLAKSKTAPDFSFNQVKTGFHEYQQDQKTWQVFSLPVSLKSTNSTSNPNLWIVAAEDNVVREQLCHSLIVTQLQPLVIGALILLLIVNLIVFFGLKPLKILASRIAERQTDSLSPINLHTPPREIKLVVDEINSLLDRIEKSVSREHQLIDAAAHEIRTPIAALQLHVQNALSATSFDEQKEALQHILRAVRRTSLMTEQLLAFSRISVPTPAEGKTWTALDVLCQEMIEAFLPLIQQKGQTLTLIKTPTDEDFTLLVAQGKIERLIQNLLQNASQYGNQGPIEVELSRQKDLIRLSVSNEGNPIPDDEKEKVFIPYYRIHGSHASHCGLGLAMVKEIVQQHQGNVYIENKTSDSGTRVVIDLPVMPLYPQKEGDDPQGSL
jgi:two-component system sensor histidine kinase QseC